jgi:hypothetical protein
MDHFLQMGEMERERERDRKCREVCGDADSNHTSKAVIEVELGRI